MRFQLADDDVKRYGLPAGWIHMNINRFANREADLLERPEPDGPGVAPEDWLEMLRGEPIERKGVPVLNEETGEPVRAPSRRTISILFWLGVRRAGVEVAWPDWDFDVLGFVMRRDDQPDDLSDAQDDDLGKDPTDPPTPTDVES